jgi:endonuclease YncB( thermonuclease family)
VQDGDTVTVKNPQSAETFKVRMAAIDCPEKKQQYGSTVSSIVSNLVLDKKVQLKAHNKDLYGRTIGEIFVNGVSLNNYLVQMGHCWAYMTKDAYILDLESQARSARTGLWADENPVPPWEFRKSKRR